MVISIGAPNLVYSGLIGFLDNNDKKPSVPDTLVISGDIFGSLWAGPICSETDSPITAKQGATQWERLAFKVLEGEARFYGGGAYSPPIEFKGLTAYQKKYAVIALARILVGKFKGKTLADIISSLQDKANFMLYCGLHSRQANPFPGQIDLKINRRDVEEIITQASKAAPKAFAQPVPLEARKMTITLIPAANVPLPAAGYSFWRRSGGTFIADAVKVLNIKVVKEGAPAEIGRVLIVAEVIAPANSTGELKFDLFVYHPEFGAFPAGGILIPGAIAIKAEEVQQTVVPIRTELETRITGKIDAPKRKRKPGLPSCSRFSVFEQPRLKAQGGCR